MCDSYRKLQAGAVVSDGALIYGCEYPDYLRTRLAAVPGGSMRVVEFGCFSLPSILVQACADRVHIGECVAVCCVLAAHAFRPTRRGG
jgi:hypothetical protein